MTDNPKGQIFAILGCTRISRADRLRVYSWITTRRIGSTNDLNERELEQVAGTLFSWEAAGHLDSQLATILGERAA